VTLSESYHDRMIRPPAGVAPLTAFVREGNRLIPQSALVTVRIEAPQADALPLPSSEEDE
jgi:hypothetical protein